MGEYDNWFCSELVELIQSVQSQDKNSILTKVTEIRRGIQYAAQKSGSISDIIVRMGEGLLGPIINDYGIDKDKGNKSSEFDIDQNELNSALKNIQKNKVVNKMSGSLSSLKDFDEK